MIRDGSDLKRARRKMRLSVYQLADLLRLKGDTAAGATFVRDMEAGRRDVSGPVAVAVEAFLGGWRPDG